MGGLSKHLARNLQGDHTNTLQQMQNCMMKHVSQVDSTHIL